MNKEILRKLAYNLLDLLELQMQQDTLTNVLTMLAEKK